MMTVPLRNTIWMFVQLELKKKIVAIFVPLFMIFIFTLKMEFHAKLFDKQDNFGFNIRMSFYCANNSSKMFYGGIGAEFLNF